MASKGSHPFDRPKPSYYEQVFSVTREIPFGRITTYGAIANYLALGSARMVGWALNKSFTGQGVPAHRVVNRKGELSGRNHFPTPTMMRELLSQEGVPVENDRVTDFDLYFWDPSEYLPPIDPINQTPINVK
jgi:methylated-DNA-protein-cysteine methyltransferase-like protein